MKFDQAAAFSEISKVLTNYNLGELLHFERNELGYNNTNFAIQTIRSGEKQDYFFRRYKLNIHPDEIKFEHAVINHLIDQNFDLVARVHQTKGGDSYFYTPTGSDSTLPTFYAIFDFLEGEDKYTWIDPHCSAIEFNDSASVLAKFHIAVTDFTPPGRRFQPKICELMPQIADYLDTCLKRSKGTSFDTLLEENHAFLLDCCSDMKVYCADLQRLEVPHLVIHCDFHPGNLKYSHQEVIALFDFDWSKIDLRSFDVALAIWYFFSNWKGAQKGSLRLDESMQFLKTYQTTLQEFPGLNPLSQIEIQQLPDMINLSNLYVLYWTITDFYSKPVEPDEYRIYLQHHINCSRWFTGRGRRLLEEAMISL